MPQVNSKMKQNKIVNQHYVPQGYLTAFTNNSDQLFAYDKAEGKLFSTSPRNVASERYFNDFSATLDPTNKTAYQSIEKAFASIESKGIPLLRRAVEIVLSVEKPSSKIPKILPSKARLNLAAFVALQLTRTKKDREFVEEVYTKIGTELMRATARDVAPEVDPQNLVQRYSEDYIKWQHLEFLFDAAPHFAKVLESKIIYFALNRTTTPFWTSDSPVVRDMQAIQSFMPIDGLSSPKIKIIYPLSPMVAMVFLDPIGYQHLKEWDGRARQISKQEVSHFNELQVKQSYRFIFSPNDQVQRAQMICTEHPGSRNLEKERYVLRDKQAVVQQFLKEVKDDEYQQVVTQIKTRTHTVKV